MVMIQRELAKAVHINGVKFVGRLTFDHEAGYMRIDIRDPGTGRLLVCAEQTEPEGEQTVETFGPLPLAVTKWLINWARSFSYPPGAADWEEADAKVLEEIAETRETIVGYRE